MVTAGPHRGGPIFYADLVGLDKILAVMKKLQTESGEDFRPAALLEKLVMEGKGFQSLNESFYKGTAKVIYTTKDGKTSKTFDALDWLAQLITPIPNRGEQNIAPSRPLGNPQS